MAHSGMACRIAHGDSTGGKRPWNGVVNQVMDCPVDSIWNGHVETLCCSTTPGGGASGCCNALCIHRAVHGAVHNPGPCAIHWASPTLWRAWGDSIGSINGDSNYDSLSDSQQGVVH